MGLSREQFYEYCGQEDHVALIYLTPGTDSYMKFGEYIVGLAIYTQKEREELEHNLHAKPRVETSGLVRIKDTVSRISEESRTELLEQGLSVNHIRFVDVAGLQNPNTFVSDADRTSRDMVIPVRILPKGRDWDWIYGFTKMRLAEGIGLPPEKMDQYYALQYYYDQEEALRENADRIFADGMMRKEVEYQLIYIKRIREEASPDELKRAVVLHHERSIERFRLMHKHLKDAGTPFEKLLKEQRDLLGELCLRVERFSQHHLNVMGKVPIYLDLDRYLHILLRHVRDFKFAPQYADKDNFQWREDEVLNVLSRVIHGIDDEAQAYWQKNPGNRFSRFGPKSYYFEGDYYTIQIEGDGRLSTLHKNKKRLPCVSDRSGTPQAGNPAEEYSGERDLEALRGGTPKHNTQHSP